MRVFLLKPGYIFWCCIGLFLLGSGCTNRAENTVLRLAHTLDATHPVHLGMAHMGERLEALSNGTMQLKIYSSGQLGSERETLELLQLGMLDLTKVASSVVENFVPAMGVYSLPYLFRDQQHYWQVFGGDIGRDILLQGEPYLVRGLAYYDAGFRSFYTTDKAINEPADLDGQKIRVMRSNVSIQSINMLGGNATPMAYGELYTSLQQGIVDGAENNPPNFYQSKHFEVCKYYILDEHSAPPDVLLIGTHTWNKLTEEQRAWIVQAVEESVAYQRQLWDEATTEALEQVANAGIEVIYPDKEPFRQAVAPLYESLEGTEIGEWADKIMNLPPPEDPSAPGDATSGGTTSGDTTQISPEVTNG